MPAIRPQQRQHLFSRIANALTAISSASALEGSVAVRRRLPYLARTLRRLRWQGYRVTCPIALRTQKPIHLKAIGQLNAQFPRPAPRVSFRDAKPVSLLDILSSLHGLVGFAQV